MNDTQKADIPAKVNPNKTDLSPTIPLKTLYANLEASDKGLSADESKRRLSRDGLNEPAASKQISLWIDIGRFFLNPLVLILLSAAVISAVVGDRINAGIIFAMVGLSVALNFVQTYRSRKAAETLRDSVAPTAMTLRDGAWSEIPRKTLTVGDVISSEADNWARHGVDFVIELFHALSS